jgi:hypothetical protein
LPNEFLQSDELAVDVEYIIKKFLKTLDAPAFSLPMHNSSSSLHLPSKVLAELLSACLVWVRRGGAIPLLYDGPFAVIRCGARSFTLWVDCKARSLLSAA